jgi:hypothetical protein
MESLKFNIFSKDKIEMHMDARLITLNAKKKTCLQSSRERSYRPRMEQTYFKSRRMVIILL